MGLMPPSDIFNVNSDKALNSLAPDYIEDLLDRPPNIRSLRSSDQLALRVPTAIVKSLVASALPSGNAPFLPENCYNYKFFGIHIFLYVVCIGPTQKNWRKPPKSDIFPHPNSTPPKMGWTKVLSPHSLPCENNCEKNAWRTPPSPKPPLQSSPTTAG